MSCALLIAQILFIHIFGVFHHLRFTIKNWDNSRLSAIPFACTGYVLRENSVHAAEIIRSWVIIGIKCLTFSVKACVKTTTLLIIFYVLIQFCYAILFFKGYFNIHNILNKLIFKAGICRIYW